MADYYQGDTVSRETDLVGFGTRAQFLTRTYFHLFGAILGFTLIEVALFQGGYAQTMAQAMLGVNWLLVLGGFVLVSWFASRAAILYDTSNILHRFPEDRYVAAALELFSSVALMSWYVLRLFMSRD